MSPASYNGTETWHAICDVKCFWNNIRRIDKTRYSSVSSLALAHLKLIVHRAAQFLYKSWPYVLWNWEQWTSKTIAQQRRGNTFWRDSRLRQGKRIRWKIISRDKNIRKIHNYKQLVLRTINFNFTILWSVWSVLEK